jgi:hypothetical protein
MQKLDLVRNVRLLAEAFHATKIAQLLALPTHNNPLSLQPAIPELVTAKSRYDVLKTTPSMQPLLSLFRCDEVYDTLPFSTLITVLSHNTAPISYFQKDVFLRAWALHRDIERFDILCQKLYSDDTFSAYQAESSPLVVLQISRTTPSIPLADLTSILSTLSELLSVLQHVYLPDTPHSIPTVTLLDSGSPLSVGVKTSVEIADALTKLFKEIFFFWISYKSYKNKVEMETLTGNLSVLEDIKKAQANGTLSEEKAKEYSVLIVRKTDDLIGLKVMPKKILDVDTTIDHPKMLEEYTSVKLLNPPNVNAELPPETTRSTVGQVST